MLAKQCYFPSSSDLRNIVTIEGYGLSCPSGLQVEKQEKNWSKTLVYSNDSLLLHVSDRYSEKDSLTLLKHENYIKFVFQLHGSMTTVIDGVGQYNITVPQVLITAIPDKAVEIDICYVSIRQSHIVICIHRDALCAKTGITVDELPAFLKNIVLRKEIVQVAQSTRINAGLLHAAQSLLTSTVHSTYLPESYYQAKIIELLCLVINQLDSKKALKTQSVSEQKVKRLYRVRDFLMQHYSMALTLDDIANMAGMSKTVVSSGFKTLFGQSIFDYIRSERMQRAYELLHHQKKTVEQVAYSLGYNHPCNFSTAFHRHFGYSPTDIDKNS